MRKITFYIDDILYFKKVNGLSDEQIEQIFEGKESFRVIYTLFGNKYIERYTLTDYDGNPVALSSLNGYQKGVILNDCKVYFGGTGKYFENGTQPFGVMRIEQETICD